MVFKSLFGSGVKRLWLYNTGIGGPDCEALSDLTASVHSLTWSFTLRRTNIILFLSLPYYYYDEHNYHNYYYDEHNHC